MPWNTGHFPKSMLHLTPNVRAKAVEIANALLAAGYEEGRAIPIATAQAKRGRSVWTLRQKLTEPIQLPESGRSSLSAASRKRQTHLAASDMRSQNLQIDDYPPSKSAALIRTSSYSNPASKGAFCTSEESKESIMNTGVGRALIAQWYRHLDKGEIFQVVGRDSEAESIVTQSFDGDIAEISEENWITLPLAFAEPPEDWTCPSTLWKSTISDTQRRIWPQEIGMNRCNVSLPKPKRVTIRANATQRVKARWAKVLRSIIST